VNFINIELKVNTKPEAQYFMRHFVGWLIAIVLGNVKEIIIKIQTNHQCSGTAKRIFNTGCNVVRKVE
jgi:hypothetical protein